jgi:hypothetical protein
MKKQTDNNFFALIGIIILSACILIFINSCQKETSKVVAKTNDASTANASASLPIVYTDINPDTVLNKSGAVYNLDINNDGIADYTITNYNSSVGITCLGKNEVLTDSSLHTLIALSSNINIGANSGLWQNASVSIASYTWKYGGCGPGGNHALPTGCIDYTDHGPFPNQSAAFLGLRFHKGLNTYYAWARLTTKSPYISSKSTGLSAFIVSIQDYAYNSGTSQPILAGQTK